MATGFIDVLAIGFILAATALILVCFKKAGPTIGGLFTAGIDMAVAMISIFFGCLFIIIIIAVAQQI